MKSYNPLAPTIARKVANVATLWGRDHRNTDEIGKALKLSEPEVQRLLNLARLRGQLDAHRTEGA